MPSCQRARAIGNGVELDARTKKASRRKARCKHLTSRVHSDAWSWLGEETVHPGSRWLDERVRVRTPTGYQRTIRSNTNSQRWFAVVRDIGRVLMSFDVVPRGGEWAGESRVDEVELGPLHRFPFAHSSDQPYFAATDRTEQGQSGIDASKERSAGTPQRELGAGSSGSRTGRGDQRGERVRIRLAFCARPASLVWGVRG